jgi:hypothetical protein
MRGAFASTGVDMSDDAWAIAFSDHLARCCGDASVHPAHCWLVTVLAEIISEGRGALRVGVEILTNPTMLVQLPAATTASPRMWVFCTITAYKAQNLPLVPWFPVCSAFLAPRLPKSLYVVLRRPSSRSTRGNCGVAPTSASFRLQSRNLVLSVATPRLS